MTVVTVTFNGVRFRRYPESENASDRTYYKPGQADRLKGVQALHQEVWKDAHWCEIPEGHHVHHADHDTENNAPDNLVLIEGGDHARHHYATDPQRRADAAKGRAIGRENARAWHSTDEGRAWHAEHARKAMAEREPIECQCENCGEAYRTKNLTNNRFCSLKCKAAARRKSGVDDEDRTCPECGETFRSSRFSKALTCSRSCGMKRSRRLRAEASGPV